MITVVGVGATVAYLFTDTIRRGQSEPQLAGVFAAGEEYDYRISRADLPVILRRRTNVWLVLQGFTAQLVFGSLVFLPRLFQAKAEDLGYSQTTAIEIGSVYATLFSLGGVFSIVGGLIGDRMQRRTPRGRALVAAVGILAGIPFYVALFFVPIRLDLADGSGSVVGAVLSSVVTEPVMAASFLSALLALALTSANSPNWFALITEVNPPEHRGTVYSLGNLTNGIGRAAGNCPGRRHVRRRWPARCRRRGTSPSGWPRSRPSSSRPASCTGSPPGPPPRTSTTCSTSSPSARRNRQHRSTHASVRARSYKFTLWFGGDKAINSSSARRLSKIK